MTAAGTARRTLRAQTEAMHQRVDDVFSTADLSDRGSYGRFLSAQAAAHLPVEQALDAADATAVVPDWPARRRGAILLADLQALGLDPPSPTPFAVDRSAASIVGTIYVLEGSRLGGALLRRSVPPSLPAQFLSANDSAAWRDLLQIIDARLRNDDELAEAVRAAQKVFRAFELAGRQFLKAS